MFHIYNYPTIHWPTFSSPPNYFVKKKYLSGVIHAFDVIAYVCDAPRAKFVSAEATKKTFLSSEIFPKMYFFDMYQPVTVLFLTQFICEFGKLCSGWA